MHPSGTPLGGFAPLGCALGVHKNSRRMYQTPLSFGRGHCNLSILSTEVYRGLWVHKNSCGMYQTPLSFGRGHCNLLNIVYRGLSRSIETRQTLTVSACYCRCPATLMAAGTSQINVNKRQSTAIRRTLDWPDAPPTHPQAKSFREIVNQAAFSLFDQITKLTKAQKNLIIKNCGLTFTLKPSFSKIF